MVEREFDERLQLAAKDAYAKAFVLISFSYQRRRGKKEKKKGVCLGFTINNRVIFDDFLFLLSYFFFFEHLGSYERDGRDVKESMLPILL